MKPQLFCNKLLSFVHWSKISREGGLPFLGLKSQQFVAERDTAEFTNQKYKDTCFQSMG